MRSSLMSGGLPSVFVLCVLLGIAQGRHAANSAPPANRSFYRHKIRLRQLHRGAIALRQRRNTIEPCQQIEVRRLPRAEQPVSQPGQQRLRLLQSVGAALLMPVAAQPVLGRHR